VKLFAQAAQDVFQDEQAISIEAIAIGSHAEGRKIETALKTLRGE
jgi:hypothetical protein